MIMKFTATVLLILTLNSCVSIRTIPGNITPHSSSTQVWEDGICYLTNESDSISVKAGINQKTGNALVLKVQIQNKKIKKLHIDPSAFRYAISNSLFQDSLNISVNAENVERNIENIDYKLANTPQPEKPSIGGVGLIIGLIDLFSKDTPEKEKRQKEDEEERSREEIAYQSKMIEYQHNFNLLTAKKEDLVNNYLKTNDLDFGKTAIGKVEFPTPLKYSSGSYVKIFLPIGDVLYSFIYDFIPNRYIKK